MSIDLDLLCLMVLLVIPAAVELSVLMGVGGCGCPISSKIVLSIITSCPFTNNAPISASAADAMTCFIIELTACNGPFKGGVEAGDFVGSADSELR